MSAFGSVGIPFDNNSFINYSISYSFFHKALKVRFLDNKMQQFNVWVQKYRTAN
jgi:hypothetical protein